MSWLLVGLQNEQNWEPGEGSTKYERKKTDRGKLLKMKGKTRKHH